jgi:hypothetical protein
MCSSSRYLKLYEAELKQKLAEALAKDKSHTEALSR